MSKVDLEKLEKRVKSSKTAFEKVKEKGSREEVRAARKSIKRAARKLSRSRKIVAKNAPPKESG